MNKENSGARDGAMFMKKSVPEPEQYHFYNGYAVLFRTNKQVQLYCDWFTCCSTVLLAQWLRM